MTLTALVAYFLRLGATGFGGPIALAGAMERDLVDQRRWFTSEEYLRGLALAQLAPGPLAAQLAIYLGWARGGILGATLVGIAFVLPSFLIVLVLSMLYIRFHGLAWMQAVFYGVGAAVIGIIARSAIKLTRLTLKRDALLWIVFTVVASLLLLRFWEMDDPMKRTGMQNGFYANIGIVGGLLLLLQNVR